MSQSQYLIQMAEHEMIPAGGARVWCGAEGVDYRGDDWTAIGRSDKQFCYCTHTEYIKHCL